MERYKTANKVSQLYDESFYILETDDLTFYKMSNLGSNESSKFLVARASAKKRSTLR